MHKSSMSIYIIKVSTRSTDLSADRLRTSVRAANLTNPGSSISSRKQNKCIPTKVIKVQLLQTLVTYLPISLREQVKLQVKLLSLLAVLQLVTSSGTPIQKH